MEARKFSLNKISIFSIANVFLLALVAAVCVYPFWNIYVYAFNNGTDAIKAPLYFWPRYLTFDNFHYALAQQGIFNALKISVARTALGTASSLVLTASLAYVMTKRKLPGYRFLSYFFFITFIFNGGFITFYLTLREIKLLDTFWVFIIPGLYNYWYMVVFRSFFDSIPASLEESAKIDGASYLQIFIQIISPLSKAVYAAIALFTAVGNWNDWFSGLYYVKKSSLLPLQSLLQKILTETQVMNQLAKNGATGLMLNSASTITPGAIKLAVVVITVTPIIVIYPFLQKYFIKGVMIGAIKG